MDISYKTFRTLFNVNNNNNKIKVVAHVADGLSVIHFLNTSAELDNYMIDRVEWQIVQNSHFPPLIQADVYLK